MSKRADAIVKELKKMEWAELYDEETVRLEQAIPPPKETKKFYYTQIWATKHIDGGERVLEVGSGIGYFAHLLINKLKISSNYTGVDVSPASVTSCKRNVPEGTFLQAYGESLPFDENTFDVVVANQMLEHVPNPEVVLGEMIRVVKPNGKVLVTVPILHALDGPDNSSKHLQHWGLYELIALFEKFGNDFKIYYLNKFGRYDNKTDEPAPKIVFAVKFWKRT